MSSEAFWLPAPPKGTQVAGGFDGSENNDWTAIKLETRQGLLFTPRYGPDERPTIWIPAEWGGKIPRDQVKVAWFEVVERYDLERVYADPGFHDESSWASDIEDWSVEMPDVQWVEWPTNQLSRMYPAIRRFEADLAARTFRHDGCPITTTHMANVVKIPKRGDTYVLGKESESQKIDAGITSILAHEAACDARADKSSRWHKKDDLPPLVFGV